MPMSGRTGRAAEPIGKIMRNFGQRRTRLGARRDWRLGLDRCRQRHRNQDEHRGF